MNLKTIYPTCPKYIVYMKGMKGFSDRTVIKEKCYLCTGYKLICETYKKFLKKGKMGKRTCADITSKLTI